MKKYVLYPGVGRVLPELPLRYIEGRQLAHCYRVPYSQCLDTDVPAIKKVIDWNRAHGGHFNSLIRLIPNADGIYRLPSPDENRLIITEGLHEAVNKNG